MAPLCRPRIGSIAPPRDINQRIERAIMYMRTSSMPLHMISDICGFADQSHFTRTFTRVTGVSPRRWRADNI
ncbi:helix-turn-helix domain-containing protein [Burkholderia cepacia]|uniref:helix-turn-helix domain-containing protein n=1 Tax=Burkholderia cepacia TaxID=292 RepID=UPI001CF528BB|nr:helix-turn-helix domain-containing protein [Burkholderia cepacia]MCA8352396.1 AraC family transcriptional regulator [Burkholderia cepacia]